MNFYNGERLSSVLEYLTPDSVYEGRCVSTKPLKNHYFFGNRLDIRSMPAIVSINIYTYHVNQNSPVPRGQGSERADLLDGVLLGDLAEL